MWGSALGIQGVGLLGFGAFGSGSWFELPVSGLGCFPKLGWILEEGLAFVVYGVICGGTQFFETLFQGVQGFEMYG